MTIDDEYFLHAAKVVEQYCAAPDNCLKSNFPADSAEMPLCNAEIRR
jgi:hypothetical protein